MTTPSSEPWKAPPNVGPEPQPYPGQPEVYYTQPPDYPAAMPGMMSPDQIPGNMPGSPVTGSLPGQLISGVADQQLSASQQWPGQPLPGAPGGPVPMPVAPPVPPVPGVPPGPGMPPMHPSQGSQAGPVSAPSPAPSPVQTVDVVVIGAGVVGSAIARELAGYQMRVALVEAREDVGTGTTKANLAQLRTGFDTSPGTLESTLVRHGQQLMLDFAQRAGVAIERTGALVVAWNPEQLAALPSVLDRAHSNGYHASQIIDPAGLYSLVPSLAPGALGAVTVPDEALICPASATLALATEAVVRGTYLMLGATVTGVQVTPESTMLQTSQGPVQTRWVINAAGVGAAAVDGLFGQQRLAILPRRSQYMVLDRFARPHVPHILMTPPSMGGRGFMITPSVYGHVMVGPWDEQIADPTQTGTTREGLEALRQRAFSMIPALADEDAIAEFAGIAPSSTGVDYQILSDPQLRYTLVSNLGESGLTASMAVGEFVRDQLAGMGVATPQRTDLPPTPRVPNLGESLPRPYADATIIERDPAYGHIVCFCERVTAGELRDVMASVIPPVNVEGLCRRTRAKRGRCQGAACGAELEAMFTADAPERSVPPLPVALNAAGAMVSTGSLPAVSADGPMAGPPNGPMPGTPQQGPAHGPQPGMPQPPPGAQHPPGMPPQGMPPHQGPYQQGGPS